MRDLSVLVGVSVLFAICLSTVAESINKNDPFMVSIVRPDGILRPFAVYDSGKWSSPWPATFRMKEPYETEMTSLADIPPAWYTPVSEMPSEWYVKETSGDNLKVYVSKPVVAKVSCVEEWGLSSDYPPKILDLRYSVWPLIKQGIAVSQPVFMNPLQEVPRYSYEWHDLGDTVLVEFRKAEKKLPHPSPDNIRATRGMSVQKLIRSEISGESSTIYYFEAEKEYWKEKPSRRGEPKYDIGLLKGWIVRADDQLRTLQVDFAYGTAYGMGIRKEQPLGIIVIDGTVYWVQEYNGYESEAYAILKVSSQGVEEVLTVRGGGC